MFRFTIRDVLWLSALVAMAAGWRFEVVRAWNREQEMMSAMKRLERDIEREGYDVMLRANGRMTKLPSNQKASPAEN